MNVQDLRDFYAAAPFQPFEIVLTNGATVRVAHPEFMAISPDQRTVHVWQLDGTSKRIDVKLVIALNETRNGARPRKRKR